jgi:hypothetical protein
MEHEPQTVWGGASATYPLRDERFAWSLRLACSGDTPEQQQEGCQRLLRAHQRSLRQRDALGFDIAI